MSAVLDSPLSNFPRALALQVQKRNGLLTSFDGLRIHAAIEKAFRAELDLPTAAPLPAAAQTKVEGFAEAVTAWCAAEAQALTAPLQVEQIQDEVERVLMLGGENRVARRYVLYREQHAQQRRTAVLRSRRADGSEAELDTAALRAAVEAACAGLGTDVQAESLFAATLNSL